MRRRRNGSRFACTMLRRTLSFSGDFDGALKITKYLKIVIVT
jgi:hypothetical protein